LQTTALAPPDIFTSDGSVNWAGGLANIENALLQVDSQTGEALVTSTGDGPAWSVLGLSNATLGKVQPELRTTVLVADEPAYYVARLTTQLDLSSTHQLNVYLQLPTGYNPWELGISEPFYIGGFADIYALFGGKRLAVPTQFESLGQLTLNQLMMRHPPQSKRWSWYVAATLTAPPAADGADAGTAPTWTIISKVLELKQLSMTLDADVYDTSDGFLTASAGTIGARFRLGSLTALDVLLQVPDQDGTWTLSASTSQTFQLSDTAQLLNEDNTALSTSMSKIGATNGFTLEQLRVSFNPETPQITAFSVAFAIQNWTIDGLSWFTMNQIRVRLDVQNPREAAQRLIRGELSSVMTIGSVQVGVLTTFDEQAIWQVRLRAQSAQLGSLDDLSNFVLPSSVTSALPAGLPTDGGLQMAAFTMRYDSQNKYLPEATFGLDAALGWDVLPGVFYIDAIHIALQVSQASPSSDKVVTGEVSALLGIGPAQFAVSASKPEASDPWTFKGSLTQSLPIDFASLLQTLLSTEWQLPSGHGFPTSLTIIAADATLVPSTGKFDFTGDALTEWSINFGSTIFAVVALGGSIHRAGSDGGDFGAELHGTFTIGDDIWGTASLALGTDTSDTVITVTVGDGTKLSPASLVSSISGTDNALSAPPQPSDFNPPPQFQAGIEFNLTQDQFFAWGELVVGADETNPLYGLVALQIKKLPAPTPPDDDSPVPSQPTWGFVLAAALKNFTFARISQSLAVVDGVISVESASIMLANYAVDAAFQQQLADKLQLGDTMTLGDQAALKAGLSLHGKLTFHTTLLGNVAALLVNIDRSTLILFAHIGGQPEDTIFSAQLGNFTVFSVIHFSSLALQYQPHVDTTTTPPAEGSDQPAQTTSVLRLLADASIDFSSGGNTTKLNFKGVMTISEQKAVFKVDANLDMTLQDPLGMLGVKLDDLFLVIDHTYAADAPPTVIAVGGAITLGRQSAEQANPTAQLSFKGQLIWVGGSPVLVDIALTQPLGLIAFFTSMFTGETYPTSYPDITFKEGRIYYYQSADGSALQYQDFDYKAGFNMHTVVSLFGLDLTLDVQVVDNQTLPDFTRPQTGVIATGSFGTPIMLWFLTLFDQSFSTSPGLELQILQSQKAFGLDVGFSFFGEHFATGFIGIGKTQGAQDTQLIGRFVYAGDIQLLKNVSIAFTYSKSQGFNLTDLPSHTPIALDLTRLASLALQGAQCSSLVNIGFEQLVRTNFYIKPKMVDSAAAPDGPQNTTLTLRITGFYAVSIIDTNNPFLFVEMPEITVRLQVADNMTLSQLPGWIVEQIVAKSDRVLEQIINQPAKLSAFLATVGAQALAKNLISDLICNPEVEESAEAAEEAAEASEAAEEAADALEAAEAAGESAETIAELSAAAETAATTAMGAAAAVGAGEGAATGVLAGVGAVVGAGIGGAVGGFFGALFGGSGDNPNGSSTGHHDHPDHQQRPKLGNPSNITVSAADADILNVHWSGVDHATYYIVRFKGSDRVPAQTTGDNRAQFNVGNLPAGSYHVEITAYSESRRPSDSVSSASFAKLAAPTLTSLTLSDQNTITVSIAQTVSDATGYHAQLLRNSQSSGDIVEMQGTPPQASFTLPDASARYSVRAYASGGSNTIPSAWQTSSDSIAPLAATAPSQVSFSAPHVTATLTANTPNATQYQAQLLVDGTPTAEMVTMQTDAAASTVSAAFTIGDDFAGNQVQVQTRALGSHNLPSPWTRSGNSITWVAAPTLQALTLREDTITVTLSAAVAGATRYQVQLLVDGTPTATPVAMTITPATADTPETISAAFTIDDTQTGTRFGVRVLAIADGQLPSVWTTSADSVTRLAQPVLQPLSVSDSTITFRLTEAVGNADSYQAQLIADGTPVGQLIPMTTTEDTPPATQAQFSIDESIAGSTFQVQVQASGANHLPSDWATSTDSITRLAAPRLQPLSLAENVLTATVAAEVTGADSYQAQLLVAGSPVGAPISMTIDAIAPNPAGFVLTNDVARKDLQVRVQALGEGHCPSLWAISADTVRYEPEPVPTNVVLSLDPNSLKVSWRYDRPNAEYEVQLFEGEDPTLVAPQPEITYDGNNATILLQDLKGNTAYRARVKALSASERQVLKNGDATDGFNNWTILQNGGNQWKIETGPAASCPGTEGNTNFVTSYGWNKKAQTIDLLAEGFTAEELDQAPEIAVSEWMCSRTDCRGLYRLIVELREANNRSVDRFDTGELRAPIAPNWVYPWEEVSHVFKEYGAGVRFIYFEHYYGSKMTGGRVYVRLSGATSTPGTWSDFSNTVTTPPPGAPSAPCGLTVVGL